MRPPRTILLSLAFLAMAAAWPARALELGRIQIDSALGEPLRALIPITAYTDAELEQLRLANASAESYQLLRLVRRPSIEVLTLEVDRGGAVPVLRIATPVPVTEPHLDLLLEVRWSAGRLLREYVLLIEPRRVLEPTPIAIPEIATVGVRAKAETAADVPGNAPANASANTPANTQTATTWPVRPGDSLSHIAHQLHLPGTSFKQRVYGIYEANPTAFVQQDIHRLRQSVNLQIPAPATLAAIPEAVAIQRLGEIISGAAVVSGKVTAAAAEAPRLGLPRDAVRISRGEEGQAKTNKDGQPHLQAIEEEVTARAHALEEAEARIAALEKSIQDLQRLLAARKAHEAMLDLSVEEKAWDIRSPQVLALLALILLPALFWGGYRLGLGFRPRSKDAKLVLPGLAGLNLDLSAVSDIHSGAENGLSLARAHVVLGEYEAARAMLTEILVRGSATDQAEARRMLDALDR